MWTDGIQRLEAVPAANVLGDVLMTSELSYVFLVGSVSRTLWVKEAGSWGKSCRAHSSKSKWLEKGWPRGSPWIASNTQFSFWFGSCHKLSVLTGFAMYHFSLGRLHAAWKMRSQLFASGWQREFARHEMVTSQPLCH